MSGTAQKTTARDRLVEERRRQQRRSRRIRASLTGAGAFVLTAALVGAVVAARSGDDLPTTYQGALAPVSRQADGSILMARPGVGAPVLEVFEDFQCPACKELEETGGATLKELAARGEAQVVYRPFHLFGESPEPTRSNSRRAANAALCVPANQWVAYHDTLFARQPDERTPGFAARDLIAWGRAAGVKDPGFDTCVTAEHKSAQVAEARRYATTRKIVGTPTLVLDGRPLPADVVFSPESLRREIRAAARKPAGRPAAPAPKPASP